MSAEFRFHRSRRRLRIFLAALILSTIAGVAFAFAAPAAGGAGTVEAAFTPFSHAALDSVLQLHLTGGRVDYGGLARDPGPLDRYLSAIRGARPADWPRAEQFAFWVNAYNAHVLKGVISHPGIGSVRDVGRKLGVPTGAFFRKRFVVAGRTLTLNEIESEILRRTFREPRVHFVLNCASASCPALPSRPLSGIDLEARLEAATREFLLDRSRNRIDPAHEIAVSSIFKWYEADFKADARSTRAFIERHWPRAERFASDAPVRFLDYDWSLNGDW